MAMRRWVATVGIGIMWMIAVSDVHAQGETAADTSWASSLSGGLISPMNGIAVLVAIAIAFIAVQAWSARPRVQNVIQKPTSTAPDQLHPALAGALASGHITGALIEATIVDLARRRAIQIEPDLEDSSQVALRIENESVHDHAFERQLVELLREQSTNDVVPHDQLSRIRRGFGAVRDELRHELESRDWFQTNTFQRRLPFYVPGWIGLAVSALAVLVAIVASDGWAVLGAVVAGFVGLVSLAAGAVVPRTTKLGEQYAIPWRGFRTGLSQTRIDNPGGIDLDEAFPYIVAMGMSAQFDKHFQEASQSGDIPNWLGDPETVRTWPQGWYFYWLSLHTALAPTDPVNAKPPSADSTRRGLFGGRF